uniref:Uncharacterized protein n=1 Tax=Fagus sylvatica TaxID=28930 RepID=A0A2N9JB00_FAGSY
MFAFSSTDYPSEYLKTNHNTPSIWESASSDLDQDDEVALLERPKKHGDETSSPHLALRPKASNNLPDEGSSAHHVSSNLTESGRPRGLTRKHKRPFSLLLSGLPILSSTDGNPGSGAHGSTTFQNEEAWLVVQLLI